MIQRLVVGLALAGLLIAPALAPESHAGRSTLAARSWPPVSTETADRAPGEGPSIQQVAIREASRERHAWNPTSAGGTLSARIPPPAGYRRLPSHRGGFGAWLRDLPLRPGRPTVRLYDGRPKAVQTAHVAVLDIDVGDKDLQHCADAIIRLRAEFMRERGCDEVIGFEFTNGDPVPWRRWQRGERPHVTNGRVAWSYIADPDPSYESFRRYLDVVFTYAGTLSLDRELDRVSDPALVEPGDVFIEGGSPGHAVIVVDVAVDERGQRAFLLAQSFMPAQEIHVLHAPASPIDPWYPASSSGVLVTPQWVSRHETLRRFPTGSCDRDGSPMIGAGGP